MKSYDAGMAGQIKNKFIAFNVDLHLFCKMKCSALQAVKHLSMSKNASSLGSCRALVHHLKDSNTEVKSLCFNLSFCGKIPVMSNKKIFASRTNFKLY